MQSHRYYFYFCFITYTLFNIGGSLSFAADGDNAEAFTIEDYFEIKHITELTLSSDGKMIAYVVERAWIEGNRTIRTVYIRSVAPDQEPRPLDQIHGARDLAWIPGTHKLSYLAPDGDLIQLYSIDVQTGAIQQYTNGLHSVAHYHFASDGKSFAWLVLSDSTSDPTEVLAKFSKSPLYKRLHDGTNGVVIDSKITSVYNFLNPDRIDTTIRPSQQFFVKPADRKEALQIRSPGKITTFQWSPNAKKLSLVYVADDIPQEPLLYKYTSVGILDIATSEFEVIAHARPPSGEKYGRYYYGGEWSPQSSDQLFIRRVIVDNPWVTRTEWTSVNLGTEKKTEIRKWSWSEIEAYGGDNAPSFFPFKDDVVYVNVTIRARRQLYRVTSSGIGPAPILQELGGSVSNVQFSANFEQAVFVHESLMNPPEIHLWRKGRNAQQLTRLNDEVADKQLPKAREVIWRSDDEVEVHGWLLEPVGEMASKAPWPLVVFVHGGPAHVMRNEFAGYFRVWPYPLMTLPLKGIAVFIPNYRGTHTFGDKFAQPTRLDSEPVADVERGIDFLIDSGVADLNRLGIAGHSHGAWLAPQIMTQKSHVFLAGSFAEGIQNLMVNYSLTAGFSNREVHDVIRGTSIYDDPQTYIDASPDLHFEGLDTAVLFEAGVKSLAVTMLGSPKAADRAGMPTEFIAYPMTGHNIDNIQIQIEAAKRNLDWFRFWLQGYEDLDPAKADQYARWRKMRDDRCTGDESEEERPTYCDM